MDARADASWVYAFGAFRLDAGRLALSYDGKPVSTTHRVLSTLLFLVENQGRTLSKLEMLDALWQGRTVEEANLSQAISNLRKVLAAHGGSDLITTVPGRGYRFVGQVERQTVASRFPQSGQAKADPARMFGGRRDRRRAYLLGGLAAAGVVVMAGVAFWRAQTPLARPAGEPMGVVLADPQDFTNDADLDHVVTQLLRADLDQSPMLQVVSNTQVAETLGLMEQPQNASLTLAKALTVCARTNGGAVIGPALSKVQHRYVLTLEAVSCADGHVLDDETSEADDKETLVREMSDLTARMRSRLGEHRASIAKYDIPLAPERTSSFEALRAYSQAEALMRQGKRMDAIPLYTHATELDPDFAMAYFGLSQAYYEFFQTAQDAAAITKAYERIRSVSERDALMIRDHYIATVTHDLDAARDNMEVMTRLYPRDANAWLNLSELRYRLADYAGAEAAGEQGLKLDPKNSSAYTTLARALNHLQQTAKADELDAQALKQVPETDQIRQQRIGWRFMRGDPVGAIKLVESAAGRPFEREALLEASNFAFADGRVDEGTKLVTQADAIGRLRNLNPDYTRATESYLGVGLYGQARAALARVPPALWNGQDDYFAARLEDPAKAQALLHRDLAERPHDTLLNGYYAPEARAALLLRHDEPREAAQAVEGVGRFMFHDLDASYLRGMALLAAKDGQDAATVFRSILAQTGFSWSAQFDLSHLGLARALRLQGDRIASRREYQAFLKAWKNADADLPILKQARAEYASLAAEAAPTSHRA